MMSGYRTGQLLALLAMLAAAVSGLAGCETTTAATSPPYTTQYVVDDSRIASDVRARLAADSANFSRVTVTSSNGVVYLTGPVDSAERSARAARIAGDVAGVQRVVNNLQTVSASPSSTVVVTPAPTTVVTSPQPVVTTAPSVVAAPEQPPIDASGVVAHYDPQTGTLTFQDGRVVRITTTSGVWGPASTGVLQPGAQVHVHNAVPVGYQPSGGQPGITSWRMGTVNRVDQANGLIYLNDGSVVHIGPATSVLYNSRRIGLAEIQPGSQIAIGMSGSSASATPPPPMSQVMPSSAYGSALPRQTVAPIESPQVQVIVIPQPR